MAECKEAYNLEMIASEPLESEGQNFTDKPLQFCDKLKISTLTEHSSLNTDENSNELIGCIKQTIQDDEKKTNKCTIESNQLNIHQSNIEAAKAIESGSFKQNINQSTNSKSQNFQQPSTNTNEQLNSSQFNRQKIVSDENKMNSGSVSVTHSESEMKLQYQGKSSFKLHFKTKSSDLEFQSLPQIIKPAKIQQQKQNMQQPKKRSALQILRSNAPQSNVPDPPSPSKSQLEISKSDQSDYDEVEKISTTTSVISKPETFDKTLIKEADNLSNVSMGLNMHSKQNSIVSFYLC